MEENHLAFGVGGARYFSVVERMLPFLLTFQIMLNLVVGCVEPESCLSKILLVVCPVTFTRPREVKIDRYGHFMVKKVGITACIFFIRGRRCEMHALQMEAAQTNCAGFFGRFSQHSE